MKITRRDSIKLGVTLGAAVAAPAVVLGWSANRASPNLNGGVYPGADQRTPSYSQFFPWINKITQIDGPDILRLKGIIAFENDPERYVIQGIHMIVEGDHQRAWKDDEKRESRLVFIGRNLDREKLERTFKACLA